MPLSPEASSSVRKRADRGGDLVVAVFGHQRDGHARALIKRLEELGARASFVSLSASMFSTLHPRGVALAGFGSRLPDGVIVRAIAAGSFEAVTRRLGILHALREQGVLVWNDARAIERCVDKSMTSFLVARAGLPTPDTWAVEGHAEALRIARRETIRGPLVLKPLFGSQGRGLRLIRSASDLPEESAVASVFYLQRFLGGAGPEHSDFRVFVSRGRIVAAMRRRAAHWVTNVKQGGRPEKVNLDQSLARLAIRSAAAVEADFAGVDILLGSDERPYVLEVNSMPAWRGLQSVASVDIAAAVAADFLDRLREGLLARRIG
ncbi:MAG: RimK family alpha-L-glutamate ligase [Hyphomicrobiales bacterium]|nr:RimK family alpha-L-glutamate ligase [Hyphomicrobiales bacterium]MBV9431909.1 RimK family alpha-L-glutamate ligase [Hyphomicrobiales bacterium]